MKKVKAYRLGKTVSEAIVRLKRIIEQGESVEIDGCGVIKSINNIFSVIDCIEKKILAYRLEKWRSENREKVRIGRPKGSVVDLYKNDIIRLIASGHTLSETCDILGLKISRVSKWMKRNGLSLKELREGNIGGGEKTPPIP